jgi:hypothetical protein
VPSDPLERTQAALYATREQAQALDGDLEGATLWIEVDCCDEAAFADAVSRADRELDARHLGLDTPVFVSGAQPQWAAVVADRLTAEGYLQVFLVTRR